MARSEVEEPTPTACSFLDVLRGCGDATDGETEIPV
jgi:hypothetical protein